LEILDAEVNVNGALKTIRGNIKISAKQSLCCYKLKKHEPWFDEGYWKVLIKGNKLSYSG
jgi:hypothetical protein